MAFSSGEACQTCKSRRIKCDQSKPVCQRCAKSRRTCLQSKPTKQASFSIHLENSYASGKAKRPRGPRSSLTTLCPHFDLQTRAMGYYLQSHTRAPTDVPSAPHALSECIYVWTVSRRACPMVDLALSSMALIVFSRVQHHPSAATEAFSNYHRLLQTAQKQISQLGASCLDEQNLDACLLAIYLMGRYEAAFSYPTDVDWRNSPSFRHHDGAMAILRLWNDTLSQTPSTFIMKQTRRGLIRSCLLRNMPLPPWLLDGSRFGERGIELEFDRIYVQIVGLHHLASSFSQPDCLEFELAEELNNKARELDEALQEWTAQLSGSRSSQQIKLEMSDNSLPIHFYTRKVLSYQTPVHASVWAHCLAARMLINDVRLTIMNVIPVGSSNEFTRDKELLECNNQLADIADDLASTVPFCLGRFKDHRQSISSNGPVTLNTREVKPYLASLIAWPLSVASSLDGINAKQQKWFRAELADLGATLGCGVFQHAETHWRKL